MALGPHVVYGRPDAAAASNQEGEPALARALRLAREVEELLEQTSSGAVVDNALKSAHSTRIVRAMAASLVDELEGLVRGARADVA